MAPMLKSSIATMLNRSWVCVVGGGGDKGRGVDSGDVEAGGV
jgi:hypothetical protein